MHAKGCRLLTPLALEELQVAVPALGWEGSLKFTWVNTPCFGSGLPSQAVCRGDGERERRQKGGQDAKEHCMGRRQRR